MSAQTPFQILLEIDQRCRALAAGLPSQQAAVQTWSGIGFRMGERLFVAPMGEVGEVLHEPRYTLLPGVKSWVKGVANVRGRLLPIMDLCGFFGNELSPLRKLRRVLVVDHQEIFAGLTVDDIDLFEINEAFAAQVLGSADDLGMDPEKLNVHGGACALGHPIGASGARLLVTLLHALQARGGKRGVASLCIGGGEATAVAIELY